LRKLLGYHSAPTPVDRSTLEEKRREENRREEKRRYSFPSFEGRGGLDIGVHLGDHQMMIILPQGMADLVGSQAAVEKSEFLVIDHIERLHGRMVSDLEFWCNFGWEFDREFNVANESVRRARMFLLWQDDPIVRIDFDISWEKTSTGFIAVPKNGEAHPTLYHYARKEEDRS
jgi:hypothetical protein